MMLDDLLTEVGWLRLEQSSLATSNGVRWPISKDTTKMVGKSWQQVEEERKEQEQASALPPLEWSLKLVSNTESVLKYEYEERQSSIMTSGRWRVTNINQEYIVLCSVMLSRKKMLKT